MGGTAGLRRRVLLASAAGLAFFTAFAVNDVGRLEVSHLEAGLGSRVVFLPDLHLHSLGRYEQAIVEKVNTISPDVVILGGDMVDGLTMDIGVLESFAGSLQAAEKFYVLGNHDYWSGYSRRVCAILEGSGFVELDGVTPSRILGRVYGFDWNDARIYPRVRFEGLAVAHDPNAADYIEGPSLMLVGHTHGGFYLGGLAVYSNSRYARGLYRLPGGRLLYVSRGLGQMLPIRPFSPPEILVVT